MSRFRFLARSHRGPIAGVFFLTLGAVLAEAAGLALVSVLLNLWMDTNATVSLPPFLSELQEYVRRSPSVFLLILGFTYLGKSGLSLLANYVSISLALKVADEWRLRLFSGLLRMPARSVPPKQGMLLQLVIDTPSVVGTGLSAVGILLQNVASALTVYLTLFWISPGITLMLTAIGVVAAIVLMALSRYARITAEGRERAYVDGYGYLTEMLSALKQVRIFGLENAVEARTETYLQRMRAANRRLSVNASSPRLIIELVFFGAAILIFATMTPRLGDTSFLSGVALAVVAAIRLLPAFSAAAGTSVQVQQSLPALRRIYDELRRLEPAGIVSSDESGRPATFDSGIECRGVRFSYPDRSAVLRGVDIRIDAGSFVAIVGTSGSGKSTLIDLLCGLYDPDGGQIAVDGRDLRAISKRDWRGLLGVVPQDAFLLSGTLRENLCLLRPDCPDELLRGALIVTGADKVVADLPEGLDTVVGERGVSLSGGQRQRLAMARVLIREPRILILDEATSALDLESDEAVYAGLERYRHRMTIIAISHRLSSIRHADRIYVMQDGAIVESGDHETLLRLNAVYAAMQRSAERQTETPTTSQEV